MTPVILIDTLARDLRKAFSEYEYSTGEGLAEDTLAVYPYAVPIEDDAREVAPSFIVIQPLKGVDDEGDHRMRVRFVIELYDEDATSGHLRLFGAIGRIREYLLQSLHVGGHFTPSPPLEWSVAEGQAYPTWQAVAECEFTLPAPNNAEALTPWLV